MLIYGTAPLFSARLTGRVEIEATVAGPYLTITAGGQAICLQRQRLIAASEQPAPQRVTSGPTTVERRF